MCTFDE